MYTRAIRSSSTVVSIGRKPGTGPRLSLLLSPNRGGRVRYLRLSASLIQALHTPILSPSIARAIWNHRSLQRLHVSIHSACSILLNFLIRSQSTAETGSNVAVVRACYEGVCHKGVYHEEGGIGGKVGVGGRVGVGGKVGIGGRVGIGGKVGIGASSSKEAFRLSGVPLLLHRASSMVY